jgi:hypothetical protein
MTVRRRPDDAGYRAAKLALADQARRDKRLDAYARVVCAEIISRAWKDAGCKDSEAWFVTVLGFSKRKIIEAIQHLKNLGYIRIEKVGRSNRYFPILEQVHNMHPSGAGTPNVCENTSEKSSGQPIGARDAMNRCTGGIDTGARDDTLIPLYPSIDPLGDPDGEGLLPGENEIQIKAKSLAMQVAGIAGLKHKPWPLHWQNAPAIVARWWDQGWTNDEILTGVRLTMQSKEKTTSGPPASIEYFEPEIGRLVAKGKQTLSPRDLQSALRAIAARIGWPAVIELSEERATDLCERWSRDEVSDEELHALKTEIEQALALRPSAATA